ncbi:MAG: class I SAM-dependent methyltransferase [Candidatus Methanofastidiosia archaeon]|jgi:ubiquinone/menaquinone biosynthesis C-methylase UbiE
MHNNSKNTPQKEYVKEQDTFYSHDRLKTRIRGWKEATRLYQSDETFKEKIIQNVSGLQVLYVGCGRDTWLDSHCTAIGIDVSVSALGHIPLRVCGDGIDLPFAPNSFDAVIFYASLHHMPSTQKALQESWRVLTKNGTLFLYEPLLGSKISRAIYKRAKAPQNYILTRVFFSWFNIDINTIAVSKHEYRLERTYLLDIVQKYFHIDEICYTGYLARDLGHLLSFVPSPLRNAGFKFLERIQDVERKIAITSWATTMYAQCTKKDSMSND